MIVLKFIGMRSHIRLPCIWRYQRYPHKSIALFLWSFLHDLRYIKARVFDVHQWSIHIRIISTNVWQVTDGTSVPRESKKAKFAFRDCQRSDLSYNVICHMFTRMTRDIDLFVTYLNWINLSDPIERNYNNERFLTSCHVLLS